MRSCDTNILLYAYHNKCPEHARARAYLQTVMASDFAVCELVLTELYVLLRNPSVLEHPESASGAADYCNHLRSNPHWQIIDYPGGLMEPIWKMAREKSFPFRGIYDARLAHTLQHYGITEFATRNTRHFERFGFKRLWNPIDHP